MRVTVIGTGHVGLVTGACLAYVGHHVTCVDSDGARIQSLIAGSVPFYEPFLQELVNAVTENGSIDFSTDAAVPINESEVIFIAVGTPPLPDGASDLQYLEQAARSIGAAMGTNRRRVIANKSTVPVGSGSLVNTLIRESLADRFRAAPSAVRFAVASNPEFLREGNAIRDSLYPDRIVVGADDSQARSLMEELYRPLIEQSFEAPTFLPRPDGLSRVPLVSTSLTNAEMIKYAANAFLATRISFANEIANICERVGAEVNEVVKGIGLDSRIGSRFLNAGIGWGGSFFGKDLKSLIHTAVEQGYRPRLLEAAEEVNRRQREWVLQRLQEKLFILKGRTIGLLGLAFKPNTDDLRDAPSLDIARRLLHMGARVRAYDPIAMPKCKRQFPELKIRYCDSPNLLVERADALVVVTEWEEFRGLALSELAARMTHAVLVDGRNVFDPKAAMTAGFDYCGVGQGLRERDQMTHELGDAGFAAAGSFA